MGDLALLPNFNFEFFNRLNLNSKLAILFDGSDIYNIETCMSVSSSILKTVKVKIKGMPIQRRYLISPLTPFRYRR
jgi:hypothetical protein